MDPDKKHSLWSPSSSKTWSTCTAAPHAIAQAMTAKLIPEDSSSPEADLGTTAHAWAYKVVTRKPGTTAESVFSQILSKEMQGNVRDYLQHTQDLINARKGTHSYEYKVPLFYRQGDVGTVDFVAFCPPGGENPGMDLIDFKYGAGVLVPAENNTQLIVYAGSIYTKFLKKYGRPIPMDFPVNLGIFQPRHYLSEEGVDWWRMELGELIERMAEISSAYDLSYSGFGEFKPSEGACQFCNIKGICKTRAEILLESAPDAVDFRHPDILPEPVAVQGEFYTPTQIRWAVEKGNQAIKLIKDIQDGERKRLLAGGERVNGVKLVRGKLGNREWKDPVAADKFLSNYLPAGERHKPPVVISPTQAEKKLKEQAKTEEGRELSTIALVKMGMADRETVERSKTECLIHRPMGGEVLALEEDPRAAIEYITEALLDAEDEPTDSEQLELGGW